MARVRGALDGLFRRHIGHRADNHAALRQQAAAGRAGQAEVHHLRPGCRDDDVLRLDISMDDATFVGCGQRLADIERGCHGTFPGTPNPGPKRSRLPRQ